jgi:hypothetical protein
VSFNHKLRIAWPDFLNGCNKPVALAWSRLDIVLSLGVFSERFRKTKMWTERLPSSTNVSGHTFRITSSFSRRFPTALNQHRKYLESLWRERNDLTVAGQAGALGVQAKGAEFI